ncbi:hypothetical protein [Streptomyces sp. NPDC004728]|uniref:hypothetical protein n=1 Tax=Streptomyces sp. NPDC004728 TaxID=3154289 RepID=UPI0033B93DE8
MIRIIRTRTLRETDSRIVELHDRAETERTRAEKLAAELAEERQAACDTGESLLRTQDVAETLRQELTAARDDLAHTKGQHTALSAQNLLDAEDRVVLRMLLRTTRRQQTTTDRVHVLFHHGRLHSLHATRDAAEIAAEAEGASRSGWTAGAPGAGLPPAEEVAWRIQQLPLSGTR